MYISRLNIIFYSLTVIKRDKTVYKKNSKWDVSILDECHTKDNEINKHGERSDKKTNLTCQRQVRISPSLK